MRFSISKQGAAALLCMAGAIMWVRSEASGTQEPIPEYRSKAIFLCNFGKFVQWPTDAFEDAGSPFVIGVLGEDPFGAFLEKAVKGQTVHERRIEIKRFKQVKDNGICHTLFISHSEKSRVAQILKQLGKSPTLTVSEIDRFPQKGGMIKFVITKEEQVKFEINPEAAKRSGLTIGSDLLELATKIIKS